MRASNIVAGVLSVALVGGAIMTFTHGLANASATTLESVCKSSTLSFNDQTKCDNDMRAAKNESAKKEIATHYQAMIDAKQEAQQGTQTPAPNATTPPAVNPAPMTPTTPTTPSTPQ